MWTGGARDRKTTTTRLSFEVLPIKIKCSLPSDVELVIIGVDIWRLGSELVAPPQGSIEPSAAGGGE